MKSNTIDGEYNEVLADLCETHDRLEDHDCDNGNDSGCEVCQSIWEKYETK